MQESLDLPGGGFEIQQLTAEQPSRMGTRRDSGINYASIILWIALQQMILNKSSRTTFVCLNGKCSQGQTPCLEAICRIQINRGCPGLTDLLPWTRKRLIMSDPENMQYLVVNIYIEPIHCDVHVRSIPCICSQILLCPVDVILHTVELTHSHEQKPIYRLFLEVEIIILFFLFFSSSRMNIKPPSCHREHY